MLLHHKAPHRTWMPDTCDLKHEKDKVYPIPGTFFDDYVGRRAAKEQRMSIAKDMNVVYDLKMTDKKGEIKTGQPGLEQGGWDRIKRMNPEQLAAWNAYYEPIIEDFKAKNLTGNDLAKWKYQRYMNDYLKCIESVDRNVGRVLDYLEKEGLLENTLVVYTSDQGFYMGEHGWFDKRFMYEESFRTPLMMRLPGGTHREINQLVQNIDYAPTFLELAGVEVPDDMQGESLLPLLKGDDPASWRTSLYYHYYEFPDEHAVKCHYGVRDGRYKLIHFYDDIDEWEFYDLQNDKWEMNNLIDRPQYKEQIDSMKNELVRLQEQYDDKVEL